MKNMEEKIVQRVREAADVLAEKKIVLYGCTFFARKVQRILREENISISAIVDNDKNNAGRKYLGIDVFLPKQYLLPYDCHKLIIVCSVHENEMLDSLHEMGYTDKNILHISYKMDINTDTLECAMKQMDIVRRGISCYESILGECGKDRMVLVAPKASGDIYIACSYLKIWCSKYKISDYVMLAAGGNIKGIAEMYGIKDKIKIISDDEMSALLTAYMFMGKALNIKLLSEWVIKTRNSYFPNRKSEVAFKDKFKYETFRLNREEQPEYPDGHGQIDCQIRSSLRKGKTIIIAPYAYSSPAPVIELSIWEEIVDALMKKGFILYTLGYGEKEPAIKNTLRIQFPYREACSILEYAGGFLAARSGICDIVHMAKCKQLVVYGRNIRNEYAVSFFDLHRNYPDFNGREIIFDDYERQGFIQYIIDYF